MKFTAPLQQFKKCMILFFVGIFCSVLSYVLYIVNPIKVILDINLQIGPKSPIFKMWEKPPVDVYVKVYIFNITNPDEFLSGEQKMKVQEIGPYVYQELLKNENVTWFENNTVSYIPKRKVVFVPEMSVGDPKMDIVNVPNVPMLGLTSSLHNAGFFVNFPFARLVSMLDCKPILKLSSHDYLWGYDDNLVHLAGSVVPNFVNFRRFGLLDRMYDEGENTVLLNTGHNGNVTDEGGRYLSIETYNGSPGMHQWGYKEPEGNETISQNTVCNTLRGSTEGVLFPMYLNKHAVFRVYRKAFCKPIPIVFKEEVMMESGLQGYLYSVADDFLDTPDENPDNDCYCSKERKCLKKGLSYITPCYYTIPSAISMPHFLNADPSIYENIEGINPQPAKHNSSIILQPTIGIPLKVNSRLQVNLIMYPNTYNSKFKVFDDLTVPLFWNDLYIPSLPSDLELLLKCVLIILPIIQTVVLCLLGITGIVLIILSIPAMLWTLNQQQEPLTPQRRESTDLRIPLNYGQYTTIHILPAIKKITSKTDLFS